LKHRKNLKWKLLEVPCPVWRVHRQHIFDRVVVVVATTQVATQVAQDFLGLQPPPLRLFSILRCSRYSRGADFTPDVTGARRDDERVQSQSHFLIKYTKER
jgi:hypothetical protein